MRSDRAVTKWSFGVCFGLTLALLTMGPGPLNATTVQTLDLSDLIGEADVIADVNVLDKQTFQSDPIRRKTIQTRIYFQVNQVFKGTPANTFFLDFPGGEINGVKRMVAGAPVPERGQRLLIFARGSNSAFFPFVGFDQGVLKVMHDNRSNVDRVFRWWGQPVNETESFLSRQPVTSDTMAAYLQTANSIQDFARRLREKVGQQ